MEDIFKNSNAEFIRRPARARGKDLKSQATNSIERAKPGKKEINFETRNAECIRTSTSAKT